ncbi:hypothetical protein JCM10908_003221 [Rhodotorula pacifica]|uniref:histidine phosphatase family protein n=1 Tax=Rhodotorula pacifica TaxID=1495444 RepID=UPI00316DAABF
MLDSIYVCRHGFRLSWETQLWTPPTGIPRDPPLSKHGVDQAKQLATFLKDDLGITSPEQARTEGVVILSSPLYRCVQTATPVADALDLPILIEPGLAEWYLPVRRGLHPALAPPHLLKQHFPRVTDAWTPLLTPPRVGESMRAIHLRCARLAPKLAQSLTDKGFRKAILFTHAATAIALVRALAGDVKEGDAVLSEGAIEPGEAEQLGLWKDEERLSVGAATCSVSKFVPSGKDEGWVRVWDGRTDFLERGEERRWDFSFVEEIAEDGIDDATGQEISATKSDQYKDLPTAAPHESKAHQAVEATGGKL